jgi:DNA-binding beta-propeller fold protein YncE
VGLSLLGHTEIPPSEATDFDHGDVDLTTGHVFIAHTALGTVEVIDPAQERHIATLPECPEASGVLCAQHERLVFAAARGAGALLVIDAATHTILHRIAVGARPNGLAWDGDRQHLLVADVADATARLVDPTQGRILATVSLPGRPRRGVYDRARQRFLLNIREPALVVALHPETMETMAAIPISVPGPHGLDIDHTRSRAYVACDGGAVIELDLTNDREVRSAPLPGVPDATWVNPQAARLYVAIGQPGVLHAIDLDTMSEQEAVITEPGAGTTAFDVQRQQLYVFLPQTSRVAIYAERERRSRSCSG